MIELRRKLLPASDRVRMCAQSALDFSWMDQVDTEHGVFVTTEGLLMYLQPDDALGLITECAARFPGGQMMFDLPPACSRPCLAAACGPRCATGSRRCRSACRCRTPQIW